ncbi:hypothetical protein WJX82_006563 [Trebouxia sp. C0006]
MYGSTPCRSSTATAFQHGSDSIPSPDLWTCKAPAPWAAAFSQPWPCWHTAPRLKTANAANNSPWSVLSRHSSTAAKPKRQMPEARSARCQCPQRSATAGVAP